MTQPAARRPSRPAAPGPRVVVVRGGPGPEHGVSLRSGGAIAAGLRSRGCVVTVCTVSPRGRWTTNGRTGLGPAIEALTDADVAVPALHGPWGEDGGFQGFLETLGLPYVGSGVLASATAMDKVRAKAVLAAAGIPVTPGRSVGGRVTPEAARRLVDELGLPLFVKPARGGSSYGVTRVIGRGDLEPAIELAARYDATVLVERAVAGREIDLGVLELPDGRLLASPPLEIHADPGEPFFTTAAKYAAAGTRFDVPAPVDAALGAALEATALGAFRALGCAGLARVDGFVDPELGLVINEVNTFPGFTAHSQYPRMWAAAGLDFGDLARTLVDTALAGRRLSSAA